jgi:hypothetical protein
MMGICIFPLHSTSEKIAYMYTFKIMFDTSIIQTQDASEMYISV